jgi:hypothetical protein
VKTQWAEVNLSGVGDHVIVPGQPGQRIQVLGVSVIAEHDTQIQFKDGPGGQ